MSGGLIKASYQRDSKMDPGETRRGHGAIDAQAMCKIHNMVETRVNVPVI